MSPIAAHRRDRTVLKMVLQSFLSRASAEFRSLIEHFWRMHYSNAHSVLTRRRRCRSLSPPSSPSPAVCIAVRWWARLQIDLSHDSTGHGKRNLFVNFIRAARLLRVETFAPADLVSEWREWQVIRYATIQWCTLELHSHTSHEAGQVHEHTRPSFESSSDSVVAVFHFIRFHANPIRSSFTFACVTAGNPSSSRQTGGGRLVLKVAHDTIFKHPFICASLQRNSSAPQAKSRKKRK